MKSNTIKESKEKLYQCHIDIKFPTSQHALHAKEVLEVDGEIGDQITKSFQVVGDSNGCSDGNTNNGNEGEINRNILSV